MEQAHRPAMADHVHRIAPMGARVLINGTWYKSSGDYRHRNSTASVSAREFARQPPRNPIKFAASAPLENTVNGKFPV
jgi:hypothetical protein